MRYILAILSSILLLVSCKKEETNNNPLINNINTMANFLFETHISEGLEKEYLITKDEGRILYTKIFEKYNVTTEQFDSAITYYTNNHKKYQEVYQKVTNKLNKYLTFAGQNFFIKYPAENINVWKDYAVFPEGLYKFTQFLPFYICPKPEYLNKPLIINK